MAELFTDLASSSLASGISLGATSLTVQSGDGALYPAPTGGDFFRLFLFKKLTGESEFVTCSARTADVVTCSATTRAYNAGDVVELRAAAAFFTSLTVTDAAIQGGDFNWEATDTGSANVYKVSLTPVPAAYSDGMPITFLPGATNTGASTLEDTGTPLLAQPILNMDGAALKSGQIVAGRPCMVTQYGTNFYLLNPAVINLANIIANTLLTAADYQATRFSENTATYAVTGSVALDTSLATYFYCTGVTTGAQTFSFSNPAATGRVTSITLELNLAATFTPIWPASVKWTDDVVPTWTTGIDIITLFTRDGGTTWYATPIAFNGS